MKKIIIAIALVAITISLSAQEQTRPHVAVGAGLGFYGPAYQTDSHPDLHLGVEYQFPVGIRAGVTAGWLHRRLAGDAVYNDYNVALRGSLYIKRLTGKNDPRWDFYAGSALGLHLMHHSTLGSTRPQFYVPVFVGTEWRFAPSWHLRAEVAYNDVGLMKIGLLRDF